MTITREDTLTSSADIVLTNIGQLLTMDPASGGSGDDMVAPLKGLGLILDGALAISSDRILWAGKESELSTQVTTSPNTQFIDAGGRVVMPGLIDCHTHLVFAGSRAQEFSRRIAGDSYEDILASGGGIHSTVKATREASLDTLVALASKRLDQFLSFGVTTVEVKSGYGLDVENELKMLQAVANLQNRHPIDLIPTFLGAHVVPNEYRHKRQEYVDMIINQMIPSVTREGLAKFCDVFCEQGAFNLEETQTILEAGLKHGLKPKLHAEQLSRSGSINLAVELKAVSVDHLECVTQEDAQTLAAHNIVAGLLPGATYFLGKTNFAPGRMLADAGCPVAVSTDFNPGSCMTENLPLMLNMACLYNKLFPREALLGATRWAAQSLDLGEEMGALIPGKIADVLVLDSCDYRNFVYHFGVNQTHLLIKRGKIVELPTRSKPIQ